MDLASWDLMEACSGDLKGLVSALGRGSDPNAPGPGGELPLSQAASCGFGEGARALLQAGAQPDALDGRGRTALMWAAGNGHAGCAVLLLEAGACADIKGKSGLTALILAAHAGHAECVEALLRWGADAGLASSLGQTALMLAVNEPECVALLLPASDARAADKDGRDALMWAASALRNRRRSVELLLDASDLERRSVSGKTAADYAWEVDEYVDGQVGPWLEERIRVCKERRDIGKAAQNAAGAAAKRKL